MKKEQTNIFFHVSNLTNIIGQPIYTVTDDLVAWKIYGDMGEAIQITLIIHGKGALIFSDTVPAPLIYALRGYARTHDIEPSPEADELETVSEVILFYRSSPVTPAG